MNYSSHNNELGSSMICSHARWGQGRVLYEVGSRRPLEAGSDACSPGSSLLVLFPSLGETPSCLLKTLLLVWCAARSLEGNWDCHVGSWGKRKWSSFDFSFFPSFFFFFFFFFLCYCGKWEISTWINKMGNRDSPHDSDHFLTLAEQEQRTKALSDATA